jgi:drug/metabolite transporter (DMT)-like permease
VSARLGELLTFSFALPFALWGVVQAFRRDHTWIAGAVVAVGACILTIVVTLRGYTLSGGAHYGVDHRIRRTPASTGEVVLAVFAALVPVGAWLVVRARRRQRQP